VEVGDESVRRVRRSLRQSCELNATRLEHRKSDTSLIREQEDVYAPLD
jgi:hypothetical protein